MIIDYICLLLNLQNSVDLAYCLCSESYTSVGVKRSNVECKVSPTASFTILK